MTRGLISAMKYISGRRLLSLSNLGRDMLAVLDHYDLIDPRKLSSKQLTLNKNATAYIGRCPLHQGADPEDFHISVVTGKWKCERCQVEGYAQEFIQRIESISAAEAELLLLQVRKFLY